MVPQLHRNEHWFIQKQLRQTLEISHDCTFVQIICDLNRCGGGEVNMNVWKA